MKNFIFQNPTRLLFGKGMVAKLPSQISKDKRILVTFGGGSVNRNGVYDQVAKALEGYEYYEFWGIEANPTVETLREAIALGKEKKVDYLLAVGGGSVVDGTKLIAMGLLYDGDAWDLVLRGGGFPYVPMGVVLTVPATGSEMNNGSVISRSETKEKYPFHNSYPEFSILDPTFAYSLSQHQLACGLVDTYVHVAEQYMTKAGQSALMDRWAEGILQTLIEIGPKVMKNPTDYDVMSQYMLCATMALNGFIAMGVSQDWASHMIGHEITALCGVTHGESLAIVYPAVMRRLTTQKKEKLMQYAERVWNIGTGSPEERIALAIKKTENFFRELGLSTRLSQLGIGDDTISEVEKRFSERGTTLGEENNVDCKMVKEILYDALKD